VKWVEGVPAPLVEFGNYLCYLSFKLLAKYTPMLAQA
jgi:hypothetical protein